MTTTFNDVCKRDYSDQDYWKKIVNMIGYEEVKQCIPFSLEELKKSKDEHFNDLSICKWNRAAGYITNGANCIRIESRLTDLYRKIGVNCYSCSEGVCILKECARMWPDEVEDLFEMTKEDYYRKKTICENFDLSSIKDMQDVKKCLQDIYDFEGGKVYIIQKTPSYLSYSGIMPMGGGKNYTISSSISLSDVKAGLERAVEDLTMAYFRAIGGEGYNTSELIEQIKKAE